MRKRKRVRGKPHRGWRGMTATLDEARNKEQHTKHDVRLNDAASYWSKNAQLGECEIGARRERRDERRGVAGGSGYTRLVPCSQHRTASESHSFQSDNISPTSCFRLTFQSTPPSEQIPFSFLSRLVQLNHASATTATATTITAAPSHSAMAEPGAAKRTPVHARAPQHNTRWSHHVALEHERVVGTCSFVSGAVLHPSRTALDPSVREQQHRAGVTVSEYHPAVALRHHCSAVTHDDCHKSHCAQLVVRITPVNIMDGDDPELKGV